MSTEQAPSILMHFPMNSGPVKYKSLDSNKHYMSNKMNLLGNIVNGWSPLWSM